MTHLLHSFLAVLLLTPIAFAQPNQTTTQTEPTNAAEAAAKQAQEQAELDRKYDSWVATLTPSQQQWEKTLQAELGSFYLPIHKREKVAGKSNAWDFVADDPTLPRILLIGDSVSRAYTQTVRRELAGIANVHRAPANCGPVSTGLKKIDTWLADGTWDFIHFNFGIHDRATPLADYTNRLEQLIERLQKTKATLVWASTTPIPDVAGKYSADSILQRNTAAAIVMKKHNIAIDDLFSTITPRLAELQNPNDVHFTGAGNEFLGHQVATFLKTLLPANSVSSLQLNSPLDYQVTQRTTRDEGTLQIAGTWQSEQAAKPTIRARLIIAGQNTNWQIIDAKFTEDTFTASLAAPAGGWHQLEVQAVADDRVIAQTTIAHVGIGEVFVVAGQSNSANHGEEKQIPQSDRVVTFDGKHWQAANDPQPGASGNRGSFIPPLGDALEKQFNVPIGFIACGIGATSVREWLPKGSIFPNPPTIERLVEKLPNGLWASKGDAFAMFVSRIKPLGPNGFRAVLWHQGESDANQKDASRTLPGELYRTYLEILITASRREIGWKAPWFVAQASYHIPGDEASPDIRNAQAAIWQDGIAQEGPDSDALKGNLRERNGQGVHFSGEGLRQHAAKWAEKVSPWLEEELKNEN